MSIDEFECDALAIEKGKPVGGLGGFQRLSKKSQRPKGTAPKALILN